MSTSNASTLSSDELLLGSIFFPEALKRLDEIVRSGSRFVHYTSAEVAMSIIQNKSVWMRNTTTMNDFSEVEHGLRCISDAWQSPVGERFRNAMDAIHPGASEETIKLYNAWQPDMRNGTYLTCISEHPPEEDEHGRLSMWRAYGGRSGIALVMNLTPFQATTTELNAFTSPVLYATSEQFRAHMDEMAGNLEIYRDKLQTFEPDTLRDNVFAALRYAALCTKHPAFREEREWRVIYSPKLAVSPVIQPVVRAVRGVPQIVQLLPLEHDPEHGLHHADISSLVHRVIIGPTEDTWVVFDAFRALLTDAGVPSAEERIWISGIPLRHFS